MIDYKKYSETSRSMVKIGVLLLLFFGVNIYFSFATDTYVTFYYGFNESARDMLYRNGRPIIALIYKIHDLSGLSNEMFYYISSLLALIFLGISIWILQNTLKRYIPNENKRILISFMSIANIFIIEYFMFIEKYGFMLAIFFSTLGVSFIEIFFRSSKKIYLLLALLTCTLTTFTYQGIIALFVILSIPFAYKYAKNILDYIKNLFFIGIPYGGALLLCMCAFKFCFQGTRINTDIQLLENIKSVITQLRFVFLYTFSMLPKYFWLGILSFIIVVSIVLLFTNKDKIQKLLHICIIIIAACILPTATIIQGSGWMAMRIIYPFASIIGALIIDIYLNNPGDNCNLKIWKISDKAVVMAILVLLTGQYLAFNNIYIDKYKVNFGDELRADYIGQAITEYQERTGNEITQIAFYEDSDMIYPTYPNLYYEGDLVVSSFYADWSRLYSINYYLGTEYTAADSEQKYIDYFKQKDWSCFSQEQLIFDGNTLHLCVY